MRILIVIHQSLPRWLGGAEVYAHQLAQSLNSLGHEAILFTREDSKTGLQPTVYDNVTTYRVNTRTPSDFDKFVAVFGHIDIERAFGEVLNQTCPDVVHFHHLLGLSANLVDIVARSKIPIVITLQDYWYVCANTKLWTNDTDQLCSGPNFGINCARCGLAKLGNNLLWLAPIFAPVFIARDRILRRLLQQAAVVIAPSRFLLNTYARLVKPLENLRFLEGGIHPPPYSPSDLPKKRPLRLLFVGSILPLKGLHILIEAFNSLPAEASLSIVGDFDRQPTYTKHLREIAKHPGINWIGPVARPVIWKWFDWTDIVVVPSLWYENAPLTIQEAYAMRRPVIASQLGAMPEWVRNQVDGALFNPDDPQALRNILAHVFVNRELLLQWHQQIRPVRTMLQLATDMLDVYRGVCN